MHFCYSVIIQFYGLVLNFASLFNKKAKKWTTGRINWKDGLHAKISKDNSFSWIHCASAGEFEQAIPLINSIKKQNNSLKIAVSFFSPSGYELYKNSKLADVFFYFPLDTRKNAAELIALLNPEFVLFVRNEIWWNTLSILHKKNIPVYLVNTNIKQKRNFIYTSYLAKTYPLFTKIFDTETFGNTKLEKATENKKENYKDAILEDFCKNSKVIFLGSSWQTEEKYMAEFFIKNKSKYPDLKIAIAPHEWDSSKKTELQNLFKQEINLYSQFSAIDTNISRILFIDKKGILKYAYRYATVAFIGGGFEKTVHNINEASVYGIPVLFGPNYTKFEEIKALIHTDSAFPVADYKEFENTLSILINEPEVNNKVRQKLNTYFSFHANASERIISEILK